MMKQVEQIEDCYEWGKENLDLPLSNVENEDFEYLISTIKHLHTENERYREALEFYADGDNYWVRWDEERKINKSKIGFDYGKTARQALEQSHD